MHNSRTGVVGPESFRSSQLVHLGSCAMFSLSH